MQRVRTGRLAEIGADHRGRDVLVHHLEAAFAPSFAYAGDQRRDDLREQADLAEQQRTSFEHALKAGGIHVRDRLEGRFQEARAGTAGLRPAHRGARRIVRRGAVRSGDQRGQPFRRQCGHLADAMPKVRDTLQEREAFHVGLGVEALVPVRPGGVDRAVALFPDPDDVGGQSGAEGDGSDGVFQFRSHWPQELDLN